MAAPGPENIVARRVIDDLIVFSGETVVPSLLAAKDAKRDEQSKLMALNDVIAEALDEIETQENNVEILEVVFEVSCVKALISACIIRLTLNYYCVPRKEIIGFLLSRSMNKKDNREDKTKKGLVFSDLASKIINIDRKMIGKDGKPLQAVRRVVFQEPIFVVEVSEADQACVQNVLNTPSYPVVDINVERIIEDVSPDADVSDAMRSDYNNDGSSGEAANVDKNAASGNVNGISSFASLNQGTWKLSQLKKLSFEEVKGEFDKLVKQVESFAPISFEATKASLKRFGEELQTKTPKRLKEDKDDEAKDDEPTKKSRKRRKQMARKGMHTSVDKNDSEGSDGIGEQEESTTGTETPINPIHVAMKTPSVATYKIIKQGEKGVYQIVREDRTYIVYINFGAMMKSISRDDLTELYRIVMNRYGMDRPEDKLEKGFWKCLRIMFEEPLSTDSIWKSMDVYMLSERTYPLSAEICKTMLDKKLQGGKPDEDCYRMLKRMEKQAG
ncbi:hypothetical protein Tco_1446884 [Tanacetum coccineum]